MVSLGSIIIHVPKYSIVVPFHNEEDNVTTLYDRLKAVMEHIGESFELVFLGAGRGFRPCAKRLHSCHGRRPSTLSRRDSQLPRQARGGLRRRQWMALSA